MDAETRRTLAATVLSTLVRVCHSFSLHSASTIAKTALPRKKQTGKRKNEKMREEQERKRKERERERRQREREREEGEKEEDRGRGREKKGGTERRGGWKIKPFLILSISLKNVPRIKNFAKQL